MKRIAGLALLLLAAAPSHSGTNTSALISAMDAEISRAYNTFRDKSPSLYYLACGIADLENLSISADFGALTHDNYDRRRILDVSARCGSFKRDNTHPLPGRTMDFYLEDVEIPLDDDPLPIRMALWRSFESEYRKSSERFAQVQALDITKAALRDKSDDFSPGKQEDFTEPRLSFQVDRVAWAGRLKRYSAVFDQYPHIYKGSASLRVSAETRTFVNTEGAKLQHSRLGYYLSIQVLTRADDGLDLPLYVSFFAWQPDALPSEEQVMASVTNLAALGEALRSAPLVDPYSGPAILQGEAAAVFMHEILGHRLEGHRQKDEKDSQTFRAMVGKSVMPDFLNVIFDPTIQFYQARPVSGFYRFDEEGTRASRVAAIEKGILKDFLMSRTPIENFPASNGHGRAQPRRAPVSRQSNLILESTDPRPAAKLRDLLIEECRKRNKPFGLLFVKVEGGFTMTGRTIPNAFNVSPLVVYRIYTDGRADELVRGVDIIGTPLTSLTKIIAAGDDVNIFNGICGAESGGVPVAAASPSILLGEIEVQKKAISRAKPPVLPPPSADPAMKGGAP